MDTQRRIIQRYSSTGEPRPADVPITVLTALILIVVLVVVALL